MVQEYNNDHCRDRQKTNLFGEGRRSPAPNQIPGASVTFIITAAGSAKMGTYLYFWVEDVSLNIIPETLNR